MQISHFIRSRLKLRHLNVVLALDETLNVSRAAEQLNVAQASVSRTLSEVEAGFGMPLFERHPRGLRRTAPGREMLRAVRQVVGEILALESLAGQFTALSRGEIAIGMHNTSAIARLAEAVSAFKVGHPNVTIRLRDGILPELLEDLHYGRLDMVFGRLTPVAADGRFGTITLTEAHMVIVAREGMPPPPAEPVALLAAKWAIPLPGTPMRDTFERFCAAHDCAPPDDRIETNNAALLSETLLRQDRYALYPAAVSMTEEPLSFGLHLLPWLKSYPFPGEVRPDRTGMIYSTSNAHSPAVAVFLEEMRAAAGAAGGD